MRMKPYAHWKSDHHFHLFEIVTEINTYNGAFGNFSKRKYRSIILRDAGNPNELLPFSRLRGDLNEIEHRFCFNHSVPKI